MIATRYGFDRDDNVLYWSNLSNHSFDELYHANESSNGYDSLGPGIFARQLLNLPPF